MVEFKKNKTIITLEYIDKEDFMKTLNMLLSAIKNTVDRQEIYPDLWTLINLAQEMLPSAEQINENIS